MNKTIPFGGLISFEEDREEIFGEQFTSTSSTLVGFHVFYDGERIGYITSKEMCDIARVLEKERRYAEVRCAVVELKRAWRYEVSKILKVFTRKK